MTGDPWNAVRAARLPAAALASLAPLRHRADIRVFPEQDALWVRWPNADADVVQALLPVAGVTFFVAQNDRWHRFQSRLPTAEVPPEGDGCSIVTLLSPESFESAPPMMMAAPPLALRVVPGGQPATATALACETIALAEWADRATTNELQSVRAARNGSRMILWAAPASSPVGGTSVLAGAPVRANELRSPPRSHGEHGRSLPSVPASVRYWGNDFLMPLGFRADPDLPVPVLRSAVGAADGDLVFLDESGATCIPRAAFQPLSRAALKLALRRGGAT